MAAGRVKPRRQATAASADRLVASAAEEPALPERPPASERMTYPADRHHPQGKLRLAYECAPLAFVIEQAGGAASTGAAAVLDVPLDSIHQRVPFAAGSREEVRRYEHFIRGRG